MANILAAIEVTPAQAALNSFLTQPGIYIAQVQATVSGSAMGPFVKAGSPPMAWFFVGPGARPTVVQISGTRFLLMFDYLSHLTVRALDLTTWPPNEVVPVPLSSPFAINFPNDALALRVSGGRTDSFGEVKTQLYPPFLKNNLLYFDPVANNYHVELQPDPSWVSNVPAGVAKFFRLYRSPLGPPVWTLIQDWTTNLDFTDTELGVLQFQYSASVGENFNPLAPNNPNDHLESDRGVISVFNSTLPPFAFQVVHADTEALSLSSTTSFGRCDAKQLFIVQAYADTIPAVKQFGTAPLLIFDPGTSSYSNMGAREAFVVFRDASFTPDTYPAELIKFGQQKNPPLAGGNAFGVVY